MDVVFERTGERRYAVRVERDGQPTLHMDPAPGYDPRLPHDLIHFVVEQELGLRLGVFGQLAAGGDAASFRLPPSPSSSSRERSRTQRRTRKRGARLGRVGRADGELSERAASICHAEWLARSPRVADRAEARDVQPYVRKVRESLSQQEREMLTEPVVRRVCERLDRVGERWSRLGVGESMVMRWED